MKRYILCWLFLFCCIATGWSQEKTVRGKVVSKDGPLYNVTILEKGSAGSGTKTEVDGSFSLRLKGSRHVLTISLVGYISQEVNVERTGNVTVNLEEDLKGLEEVVVVGYGTKKKVTNTGAISSISGDAIRQSPSASLQNNLAGRIPGFFSQQRSGQPGRDGASFQIRGVTSYVSGSNNPLIIVDDIEYSMDQVNQIDPNEIESLTLLKDAATTSIYGVRGANGVLVITTRRGKIGKPMLNFKNETGILMNTQTPDVNSNYNTLRLLKENAAMKFLNPETQYPKYFGEGNLEHYRLNDRPYDFPNVDWWDVLMKKYTVQNRSNFDISGGTEKTKYFLSLGFITQGGMYKDFTKDQGYNGNYFLNRYTLRSNIDLDPTKDLHIRLDMSGRFSTINEPNDKSWNGGGTTFQYLWNGQLSAFGYPLYNPNGTFGGSNLGSSQKPNPVANLMYSGYNREQGNDMNLVGQASHKLNFITPGLSADVLLSYSSDYSYMRSLTRNSGEILTYFYDPVSDTYAPVTPNLYRMGKLNRSGRLNDTKKMMNAQMALRYSRSFSGHNISALAMVNRLSTTRGIYKSESGTGSEVTYAYEPYNVQGFVSRLSYDYKNKYMLEFVGAYNGSDKFSSNKSYQLFPAVSLGWNISEESFLKDNFSFVSSMKLRGSFGYTGFDGSGVQVLKYEKTYSSGSGKEYVFGETGNSAVDGGLIEPQLANPFVTWESQRDFNVGMDATFFNGDIGLTFDYFDKYRYDILTTRTSVGANFGVTLPPVNLGETQNRGYEIEFKYRNNKKEFKYWFNGQLSLAKSKILFRDEGSQRYPWLGSTGKPIGAEFGYTANGFFKDIEDIYNSPRLASSIPLQNTFPGGIKLVDLNGDGVINQYDQGYLGTRNTPYIAGFSLGFSYKSFDFSTLFQGAFGNIIAINRGLIAYERPEYQSVPFNLGRWTPQMGENAAFPALNMDVQSTPLSSFWTRKGDYIRWKNIEMGYTFPKSLAERIHIKNLRVYLNGYNMGLIYTGLPVFIDPESNFSTGAGEYPQQRIFNFGIQFGL